MTEATILELGRQSFLTVMTVATPLLSVAVLVGVAVSLFQAITHIQEITLSFVPKIVAVFLVLAACGPWMLANLLSFTARLLIGFPSILGQTP